MKRFVFLLFFLLLPIVTANATTYYIKNGGNDGLSGTSDANAWATISKVNSVAFSDGDTICLKRGSTFTDARLTLSACVSPGITGITVQDYGTGDKPWINGDVIFPIRIDCESNQYSIKNLTLKNIDYSGQNVYTGGKITQGYLRYLDGITLDGLYFNGHGGATNQNEYGACAMNVYWSRGAVEIKNCTIFNCGPSNIADSNEGKDIAGLAISWKNSGTLSIHDNVIHDTESDNLYLGGVTVATDIYDNTLYNGGENSLDLKATQNITVRDNEMYCEAGFGWGGGSGGPLIVAHGDPVFDRPSQPEPCGWAYNCTIRDNYLHDAREAGIILCATTHTSGNYLPYSQIGESYPTRDFVIQDNVFENCPINTSVSSPSGTAKCGIGVWNLCEGTTVTGNLFKNCMIYAIYETNSATDYTTITNNTIYDDATKNITYGIYLKSAVGTVVKNNVVYLTEDGTGDRCLKFDSGSPVVTYNCWYNAGTENTLTQWGGTTYESSQEAAWQSAGHTGGIFQDPLFIDPANDNFMLQTNTPAQTGGVIWGSENDALPVFPGAVGYGTNTVAGRGTNNTTIYKVTNLNTSGTGSFYAAVKASGPRLVVFEVSGTIPIDGYLSIVNPYITIAGQTAPSPGITLRGATLDIRTHDVLMQHIRIRNGDNASWYVPQLRDCMSVGSSSSSVYNIVIDHCTLSWAVDEILEFWYDTTDSCTVSNCIISEALKNSIHPEGVHGAGLIVGPGIDNISLTGNLFAHNYFRNPYIRGSGVVFSNNVVYDAGLYGLMMQDIENPIELSHVGNVIIPGLDSGSYASYALTMWEDFDHAGTGTHVYMSDNDSPQSGSDAWDTVSIRAYSHTPDAAAIEAATRVETAPLCPSGFTAAASSTVESSVLNSAGARPADRDVADTRVIADVTAGTGGHIDSPSAFAGQSGYDSNGYPILAQNYRALTDIPTNPNDDDDYDGYLNWEEWLWDYSDAVEGEGSTPPQAETVFSDIEYFGDRDNYTELNSSRWEIKADGGDRYFLNSTTHTGPGQNRIGEYTLVNNRTYGDFEFTCTAKLNEDSGTNPYADECIVFGYQGPADYYYAFYSYTDIFVRKCVSGTDGEIISITYDYYIPDDGYHDLKVTRVDDLITVYLDDIERLSVTDSTLGVGQIGVGTYNDSAYFDDINVTEPSAYIPLPYWYVYSGGDNSPGYGTTDQANPASADNWSNAFTALSSAISGAAAGDTIYIASDHDETATTGALTWAGSGTLTNPLHVISVDRTTGNYTAAASAQIGNTGITDDITLSGSFEFLGTYLSVGDDLMYSPVTGHLVFDDCTLDLGIAGAEAVNTLGGVATVVELFDTDIDRGASTVCKINVAGGSFLWAGGSLLAAMNDQLLEAGAGTIDVDVTDCDLSVQTDYLIKPDSSGLVNAMFARCKTGAATGPVLGTLSAGRVAMESCDDADGFFHLHHVYPEGSVEQSTTNYRTGGASYDGNNHYSARMTAASGVSEWIKPLRFRLANLWTAANPTLTVHTLTDGVTLQNDEFWIEVESPDGTTRALGNITRTRAADIRTTPADHTSDLTAWTETLSNEVAQKIEVAITGSAGVYTVWACLAKPSTTVYVCPKIGISH